MKPFAKRLLALASAAAITITILPAVSAAYRPETSYTGVADWALYEVTAMDQLGLIPESLMDADLSGEITRSQMCSLAVATYEEVTGMIPAVGRNSPFTDTDDLDVRKAHSLGIVQGDGNGLFRPDDSLTRLEFFCFVGRYLRASGMETSPEDYSDLKQFTDAASLPAWAMEPTQLTVGLQIVKGSGTALNWDRTASAQEALAMFNRARNASVGHKHADEFTELADWAEQSVLWMDQLGVVPATMKAAPMTADLTRADLSRMAMGGYRLLNGVTNEELGEPEQFFTDTDDVDVQNAYALGIVSSMGNGTFQPDASVSRQDFYTAACSFLESVGYPHTEDVIRDLSKFSDGSDIAAYAKQPTAVMLAIGAIEGENGKLNPVESISAQESVVIFQRVIDAYADYQETGEAPERYLGQQVSDIALSKVGCRYVLGSQGPNKFDCSGLVYYVYKQFGYDLQPGARNQWSLLGNTVKRADLLPGDLLFYSDNGRASGIFHVGIYIGDGQFVHAANSRKGVIVSHMDEAWYANRYLGAKRAI